VAEAAAADPADPAERLRRWRMVLGADRTGGEGLGVVLDPVDVARDEALDAVYGDGPGRVGGLGGSAPQVARWLGDIRSRFPRGVVEVVQRDAMTRFGLAELLLDPEVLDAVQPDVGLVTTLLGLGSAIPDRAREAARTVVRSVTDDLRRRLEQPTRQAVGGAVDRSARTRRPRPADIDWGATVAANLRHYQPDHRTVVPHRLVGRARRRRHVDRRIVLCIDQSGSMAASVVYASVFAAVLASLPALDVRVVAFDTAVVDLSEQVEDPVDLLFGIQLGGGTDINQALAYCQQLIDRPDETVLVLLSDLLEGGVQEEMLRRAAQLVTAGVTVVALLALADSGKPAFDAGNAAALAQLGVPAFACTPELFPDLMAAAVQRRDLARWAGEHDLVVAEPPPA
jgi:Mg-chelatase subunit ChlD